jgi:hypothetical protein
MASLPRLKFRLTLQIQSQPPSRLARDPRLDASNTLREQESRAYGHLTLLRQATHGDWAAAVERMARSGLWEISERTTNLLPDADYELIPVFRKTFIYK